MICPRGETNSTLTPLIGLLSASKTTALSVTLPPRSVPQVASLTCASTVEMVASAAPALTRKLTLPSLSPAVAVTTMVPGGATPGGMTTCTCATPSWRVPSGSTTLRVVVAMGRR